MAKTSVQRINQSDLIDEIADDFSGIYDRRTIQDIICDLEDVIIITCVLQLWRNLFLSDLSGA